MLRGHYRRGANGVSTTGVTGSVNGFEREGHVWAGDRNMLKRRRLRGMNEERTLFARFVSAVGGIGGSPLRASHLVLAEVFRIQRLKKELQGLVLVPRQGQLGTIEDGPGGKDGNLCTERNGHGIRRPGVRAPQ